jgi:hypothetical protein
MLQVAYARFDFPHVIAHGINGAANMAQMLQDQIVGFVRHIGKYSTEYNNENLAILPLFDAHGPFAIDSRRNARYISQA